jgi:2-polyprenyl-3-methyl-5-hydroxy-6-metoxy-1,4-benzoquinol methylase
MASESELAELQRTLYVSRNPTRRWLHCSRRALITDAIKRFGRKELALEVGFGSGVYLPVLSELYQEVTASDVEDAHLRLSPMLQASHPNLQVVFDDITHSNLPEKHFDLILCTEVVEHIPDSASAIAGMHRLLKPGGILVLSTPQRWSPLEVTAKIAFMPGIIDVVRAIYREPIIETGHINLMTEEEVTDQLTAAGFHIRERFTSGMYLPFVAEFLGEFGLRLEKALELKLNESRFSWLLWTQYYIAEASPSVAPV